MNSPWNFILNFEESGLLLLKKAYEVSNSLLDNANSEIIVETLCHTCSSEEISYSDFLRISCQQYRVFKAESSDEDLENLLLGYILSEYVRRMSEEEYKKFALDQGFTSNEFVDFKMELKIRMASSASFIQKLPLLVLSLVGIDITDYLVIPEMFGVSHPKAIVCKDIPSHFPILSAIIALSKENRRQFSKDNYYKYLDFLIRTDNVFPSQKESTLSVMLSAYQVLGDKSTSWFESVKKSVSDYLGGRKTHITRHAIESMKEFYDSSKDSLMYRLMKRLFPCEEMTGECYHGIFLSNHIQLEEGADRIVFYDYLFPYSPILNNACYVLQESTFENLAVQLFLAVSRNPYECLLPKPDLKKREYDYVIVKDFDDCQNTKANKKVLKTTAAFDYDIIRDNVEKFVVKTQQELSKLSVLVEIELNNLKVQSDELSKKGMENAFAIAPENPNDNENWSKNQSEKDKERRQLEYDYRKCKATENFICGQIVPRIESIRSVFIDEKNCKPIDFDLLEQQVSEVAEYLKDVGKSDGKNQTFEFQVELIGRESIQEKDFDICKVNPQEIAEKAYCRDKSNEFLKNKIEFFIQNTHIIRHDSAPFIGEIRAAISQLREKQNVDIDFVIKEIDCLIEKIKIICSNGRIQNEEIELISEIDSFVNHYKDNKLYTFVENFSCDNAHICFGNSDLHSIFQNVFNNIEHHAFWGVNTYQEKNKVMISINKNATAIVVKISNNGMPFEGDVEKVFDFKQKYGKTGHSGIGLFSVKKIMNDYGGSARFVSEPDREFCVTLELRFKLNNLI